MNTDPPLVISILFVVVPIFILAIATIIIGTIIARSFGSGPGGTQGNRRSNLYPDPMMDPANPMSPLYQATQMSLPPDGQTPPATDDHRHHGGHHHGGGVDPGTPPFDGGHHGGGFDGGGHGGGHH
jgi:hypothetical protein